VIKWVVGGVVGLLLLYGAMNLLSYFDPLGRCYISLSVDLLDGDRAGLRRAITTLKREDRAGYRLLCDHVSEVVERHCVNPMFVRPKAHAVPLAPGCYVRGSHAIYLKPDEGATDPAALAQLRAAALKKYAGFSRDFWAVRR